MSSLFLTDPDKVSLDSLLNPEKKQSGNKFIRFKENVCQELQSLGVPFRAAEVAVIDDIGGIMKQHLVERIGPRATAEHMFNTVLNNYKTDNKWHYDIQLDNNYNDTESDTISNID
jgi:hypothetical protein